MGTFSRLRYVIAANANALIEKAEDPEKLLRALIREMEDAGEEARAASAGLLAEEQHLERLAVQLNAEAEQWQHRAEQAVQRQQDELARAAIKARTEVLDRHNAIRSEQASVRERSAQMEKDMVTLKSKLAEAKLKVKSLQLRPAPGPQAATLTAQSLSPSEKRVREALGRFDRLQVQVENLEARVRSYEVGGPAPRVWDAAAGSADPAVEEELARMKEQLNQVMALPRSAQN
jgi:phage shock protein A